MSRLSVYGITIGIGIVVIGGSLFAIASGVSEAMGTNVHGNGDGLKLSVALLLTIRTAQSFVIGVMRVTLNCRNLALK